MGSVEVTRIRDRLLNSCGLGHLLKYLLGSTYSQLLAMVSTGKMLQELKSVKGGPP